VLTCSVSQRSETMSFPDVYRRLMDAVDPDLTATAETTLRQTDGVRDIEQVRLRWIGHRLRAEAGIVVESSLHIVAAHAIATHAHHRLLHAIPKLVGATVHVSPSDAGGDPHQLLAHHHVSLRDCPRPRSARSCSASSLPPEAAR
jgi:divalent metal cation (Fe/Co/Zn/Cd) transporter